MKTSFRMGALLYYFTIPFLSYGFAPTEPKIMAIGALLYYFTIPFLSYGFAPMEPQNNGCRGIIILFYYPVFKLWLCTNGTPK